MKLKTIIKEDEGSIRDLMARFVNANKKDSKRAHDKWMSMILTRLIDLGFVSKIRKQIMYALDDVVNQKQFDTLVAQYKLFGDYADSFSPTESSGEIKATPARGRMIARKIKTGTSLATALREAENEDQEDIESDVGGVKKNFKLILEIPFTTTENKDQKIRRLKYDLGINNIGIEDIQPVNVAELGQGVIDFQAVVYISTELTRSELTSALEPDYKISKMQRLDQESAQDANT